ncbi:MAG: T9SS type A sorting domain-containing protein [Bacteroidetes bacterium]|nr:T9SS type A sorting domain-containing protein [Bacteroidota bacterium]
MTLQYISRSCIRSIRTWHVLLTATLALLCAMQLCAQTYQYSYGAQVEAARYHPIEYTADGGTIMVGTTQDAGGIKYVYLQKLNSTGGLVWDRILGDGKEDNEGYDVIETRDFDGKTTGYVVTGIHIRNRGFQIKDTDVYIARIRANGAVSWQYSYGGVSTAYTQIGYSITQIINGYAVAGLWRIPGMANSSDVLFMTIDTTGGLTLAETIGQSNIDDGAFALTYTGNEVGIAGYTMNTGKTDGMVLRVDPTTGLILGNPHRYGNLANDDTLYSIEQVRGIYFVCAGTTGYKKDHMDMLGIEVEIGTGNLVWGNTYAAFVSPNFNRINMGADLQDIGKTYGIVGTTSQTLDAPPSLYPDYVLLAKLDYLNGAPVAGSGTAKIYGGASGTQMTSIGYALRGIPGSSGKCLVAGQEDFNTVSVSPPDMYLIRTDANLTSGCNEGDPEMSYEVYTTNDYIFPSRVEVKLNQFDQFTDTSFMWKPNQLCFCAFCKHVIEPVGADAAGEEKLSLSIATDPASGDVSVQVRTPGDGVVEVYDMMGHRVRTLLQNTSASGNAALAWDGADDAGARLPNGMYVIQLRASSGTTSQPVRIVR